MFAWRFRVQFYLELILSFTFCYVLLHNFDWIEIDASDFDFFSFDDYFYSYFLIFFTHLLNYRVNFYSFYEIHYDYSNFYYKHRFFNS